MTEEVLLYFGLANLTIAISLFASSITANKVFKE